MKNIDIFTKKIFALFILLAVLFILFPNIDIYVSSLFYKDKHFYLSNREYIKIIYILTMDIIKYFFLILLILLSLKLIFKTFLRNISYKVFIYLILSGIIGPVIVVNGILKTNSGRARPIYIKYFGGNKKFTPAFIPAHECDTNCSFSSGHAAAGFFFISLIPLIRGKKYKITFSIITLSWGFLASFARVAAGKHFLSDVLFSLFFVYFSARFSYYLVYEKNIFNIKEEKS